MSIKHMISGGPRRKGGRGKEAPRRGKGGDEGRGMVSKWGFRPLTRLPRLRGACAAVSAFSMPV